MFAGRGAVPHVTILAAVVAALASLAGPRDLSAQAAPWWDPAYAGARQVTLTAGARPLPSGTVVSLTFDHAALVGAGLSRNDGNDIRLIYRSGGVNTELPRVLANLSVWNNASTKLMFRTQAALAAAASDANYFLYYGNPAAGVPPTAGVPSARLFQVTSIPAQTTTSGAFVNVTNGSLTFTPGLATDVWVIFATGVLASGGTGDNGSQMQMLVNGTVVDLWGQKNKSSDTPNGSGFLIFDRITGSTAPQTVQLQYLSGQTSTTVSSVRLVAALLPQAADVQFVEGDAAVQLTKGQVNVVLQTLAFTPSAAGDYYVFGKLCQNDPGGGTAQAWLREDDTGDTHPNAPAGVHASNPSNAQASFTTVFRKALPAAPRTFTLRGTAGGNNGSFYAYRRIMAFRADAWEGDEYAESLGLSTSTGTGLISKTSLTTAAPAAARDYLVLQNQRISGSQDQNLVKSGELRDGGATVLRTNHRIDQDGSALGYHHVAAAVQAKTTAAAAAYENLFQSSNAARTVECADSTIAALRYLEPSVAMRPVVRDLSSTALDGAYKIGDVIPVQVRFSEVVAVAGTPLLALETGAADAVLTYGSGSGTSTLTFLYTVAAGHTSPDLDAASTSALSLNGGSIVNPLTGTAADLALPAPGATGSLGAAKALVVDGLLPTTPGTPAGTPTPNITGTFTVTWGASTDAGGSGAGTVAYALSRSADGGSTWAVVAPSLAAASFGESALPEGVYLFQVQAADLAGNLSALSGVSAPVVVDKTAPTVVAVTADQASPTGLATVSYTVTFSEPVVNLDAADFTLATAGVAGAGVSGVTGSGTTWMVAIGTGTGSGTLQLALAGSPSVSDPAGNPLAGGLPAVPVYAIDKMPPAVVSIVAVQASPTSLGTVDYTVTFSEAVTGVDAADFSVAVVNITGAGVTAVAGTGATRTVSVNTGAGDGTLQLDLVDNDTAVDVAGNPLGGAGPGNGNSSGPAYTVDKSLPTVLSIARAGSTPTNAASVDFTVTFSEAVTGVDIGDFALATTLVAGASLTSVTGAGAVWTATVATGTGDGTLGLNLVDNDTIRDVALNALAGAGNGSAAGQVYVVDKTAPSVLSIAPAGTSPTNAASVTFTATFSEGVTGVDAADFALATSGVAGAMITGVAGAGAVWTVSVSTGTGDGTIGLNLVDDDSIRDFATNALGGSGAGNGNFAGGAYAVDKTIPAVQSILRSGTSPTNAPSVSFAVTFTEDVTGVDSGDFALATSGIAGALITGVSGAGASWTVVVGTGTGDGTIGLNLVDNDSIRDFATNALGGSGAGNGNHAGPAYTVDKSLPTVASILRAGPLATNATSVDFTVTFSEAVTGVDGGDFALATTGVTGAAISGVTGAGAIWTVSVGTGTGDGTIGLNLVDDDSIQDAAFNPLAGPGAGNGNFTGAAYAIDKSAPVVQSIARVGASPTNAASVAFTVTFNEAVTGVDPGDFALATTGVAGAAISGVSGAAAVWTVSVATGTGDGTLGLNLVDNDSIQDAATNPVGGIGGGTFVGAVYDLDKTAPTVQSIVRTGASPTNAAFVGFTVTFTEPVTGVDAGDFVAAATGVAGADVAAVGGSGAIYTVSVGTGTGDGSVGLNLVDDDSIQDAVGNRLGGTSVGNGNAVGPVYVVDRSAPAVLSIVPVGTSPTNAASVAFTVTFSEDVTGVDLGDFALSTSGVAGASISGVSGSDLTWTVSVDTGTGDGSLGLNLVDDNSIQDAALNVLGPADVGFTGPALAIDKTAPAVASIARSGASPTNAASVTFTVSFSESVTGVDLGDFALATSGVAGAALTGISGAGTAWTVSVATGTGDGTIGLNLADNDSIQDEAGNALGGAGLGNGNAAGELYALDRTPPAVASITRMGPSPTNAATLVFAVAFSENVTGVDLADFGLATTGTISGAALVSRSGAGSAWTVTVSSGTGDGTIGLNLADDDSILDEAGNRLGGTGAGNGSFTGESYVLDRLAPVVSSLTRTNLNPTNGAGVGFSVVFSRSVTGVDASDFAVVSSAGLSGVGPAVVSGSGTTYTVTVSTGAGDGTLQLNVVDDDSIVDVLGNPLAGPGAGNGNYTGVAYQVDRTAPTVAQIALLDPTPTNLAGVRFEITFSEPVGGLDAADLALQASGGLSGTSIVSVTGAGTTWTVTANAGAGEGTLALNVLDDDSVADLAGNPLGGPGVGNGGQLSSAYTIDRAAPTVLSIVLAGASPTNAASVDFTVTFSEAVTGVDASNFVLTVGGLAGAGISGIAGSGAVRTVSVSTGSGDGTLQLAMAAAPSAADIGGNAVAPPFPAPATCTVDRTPPGIVLSGPSPAVTSAGPVTYTVTYAGADAVTLAPGDVLLQATGSATGTVGVSGSGTGSRLITISGISGSGTLAVTVAAGTAQDLAGNAAPGAGPGAPVTVELPALSPPSALQVELLANPTSVQEGTPRFSAIHNSSGSPPPAASRFQIQVSTDPSFAAMTHWNSPAAGTLFLGGVTVPGGQRSPQVRYGSGGHQGGAVPLLSWNAPYAWRARFLDVDGNDSGFSTEPATFRMASPSASVSANGNGAPGADSWRFIGVPIAVGSTVPATELLEHSPFVYRWDEPGRSWVALGAGDVLEGGRGYLVWASPSLTVDLKSGAVALGSQAVDLSYTTLAVPTGAEVVEAKPANWFRGAHFLCNPFNGPISWNDPTLGHVDKTNLSKTYTKWDGTQYLTYSSETQLGSAGPLIGRFQAFGVNVLSDTPGPDVVVQDASVVASPLSVSGSDANAWSLNLVARTGAAVDSENYLGVHPRAQDAWDARDAEEPGHGATTWVLLYFDHTGWPARGRWYTHDFRKTPLAAGAEVVWTATVESNASAPVTVAWPDAGLLPLSDWAVTVEDPAGGGPLDLATTPSIEVDARGGPRTLVFKAVRLTNAFGELTVVPTPGGPAPTEAAPGAALVPMMAVDLRAQGEAAVVGRWVVRHAGTGDPARVQVSLYRGTQRVAGPSPFSDTGVVAWTGLNAAIADLAVDTWGVVYDFAADAEGTYAAVIRAEDLEAVGQTSGVTLVPAPALLQGSTVTVSAPAPTEETSASTAAAGGGGGNGRCGLLGLECLLLMALARIRRGGARVRG
jgi:hypothetical protein